MQYHRERENRERQEDLQKIANANAASGLDHFMDLQRQLYANQHLGYPDGSSASGGPGSSSNSLQNPMLHNPGSPNPASLAGLAGFPPGADRYDLSGRLSQPDQFRLHMEALAAAHLAMGNPHDPPGGVGGQGSNLGGPGGPLGLPPLPPHSQVDSLNPLSFHGAPGLRPMMPGRDQYFNPQRYSSYGSPYGLPPSPFFGLGGPPPP